MERKRPSIPWTTTCLRLGKRCYERLTAAVNWFWSCVFTRLPDVERELQRAPAQKEEFEGVHGPVSEAKSAAILEQLETGTGAADILQNHLAYEQAFNLGSPLILGNKVTLLQ